MENQKSAIGLDGNLAAAIGYPIGLIALILIFIEKENKFVRFHAIQSILWGFFLSLVMIVIAVVFIVLGLILSQILGATVAWILWALMCVILVVLALVGLVVMVMAAVKAYGGQRYNLPVVGKFAEKWSS